MDQGHHHVNISPLFVGLLGVISGAIIVATFHCILVACSNSSSESDTSQPPSQPPPLPRVYRRTLANTTAQNYNPANVSSSSSSSSDGSNNGSTSTSMNASMTHSLDDVRKFSKEFKEGTCAVCLGEFQENEDIRILPECAHVFHVSCIDMWLHSQANCPLCRAVTTPRGHHVVIAFPETVGIVA